MRLGEERLGEEHVKRNARRLLQPTDGGGHRTKLPGGGGLPASGVITDRYVKNPARTPVKPVGTEAINVQAIGGDLAAAALNAGTRRAARHWG